jgi:hypothetical protein
VYPLFAQSTSENGEKKNSAIKPIIVNSTVGLSSTGSLIALRALWYSKETQSSFHLFDDSRNWMQMDKLGHAYSSYQLTREISHAYTWAGIHPKKSALYSSAIAVGYLSAIEIMDGFSSNWGFSLSDMTFNFLGSGLFLFQESFFSKQIIQAKFSFHPTPYAELRPEVLGNNFFESILKDYNGQTYWISFSPGNLGVENWPKWLMLSFGHSVDGKLKGDSDNYLGYTSSREFLFSLDIDLTQIRVKSKVLKSVFDLLNCVKVPFPALIYSKNEFNAIPIYF